MSDENNWDFEYFFNERLKERGLTIKQLSELSGIAVKHLDNIGRGVYSKLPAEPYLRGYLSRLGKILDFDPEVWQEKLKYGGFLKSSAVPTSTSQTKLMWPSIAKIATACLAAVVVAFIGLGALGIFAMPIISVINPAENPAHTNVNEIDLRGTLKNGGGLSINGEPVTTDQNGTWDKQVLLQSGTNSFEIKAKKFLGGGTKILEQIFYEPGAGSAPTNDLNP